MKSDDSRAESLYTTDEYILKNPTLHEEDSSWKVSKIIPLLDRFAAECKKKEINLLDVGGGAGTILRETSSYLHKRHSIRVNGFALDLSPGMLKLQKEKNPEVKCINRDIRETGLGNKQMDLTLMIDVIEHVPSPEKALKEIKRISDFVIFKVPLEDNLSLRLWNLLRRGEPRRRWAETIGHVNIYTPGRIRRMVEEHAGRIVEFGFSNVFGYYLHSDFYMQRMGPGGKILARAGAVAYRISPRLSSFLFSDFAMILAEC